jgi:hypothetical protein
MAAAERRDVLRNPTYAVFGLGIDAAVVLVAVLGLTSGHAAALGVIVTAAALAPFLALGLRVALIRVVTDAQGVRVVNLWRTHRVDWAEAEGFVLNQPNLERFARWGRFQAFLGLARLRCVDGREINISAVSAGGSMTETQRFLRSKLPEIVERLNRGKPGAALAVRAGG